MVNEEYTVELKPRQHTYLEQMAKKYELPDASKALRCLIDFAYQKSDLESEMFETVRCLDC